MDRRSKNVNLTGTYMRTLELIALGCCGGGTACVGGRRGSSGRGSGRGSSFSLGLALALALLLASACLSISKVVTLSLASFAFLASGHVHLGTSCTPCLSVSEMVAFLNASVVIGSVVIAIIVDLTLVETVFFIVDKGHGITLGDVVMVFTVMSLEESSKCIVAQEAWVWHGDSVDSSRWHIDDGQRTEDSKSCDEDR